jgi:hypothetical protein
LVVVPCSLVEVFQNFRGACCPIMPSITLMMDAASISEIMVNFYETTYCNIPEESHHYTCYCENQKFEKMNFNLLIGIVSSKIKVSTLLMLKATI